MDFHKLSYSRHEQEHPAHGKLLSLDLYKNWFDSGTVDVWRHLRMFSLIDPLLEEFKGATWLTVGDGTYGTASIYIQRKGGQALPIDIHVSLLETAKEHGLIADFKKENAEAISFEDNSFDFSFCKESYHHFPRPFIALYEMLRVSRRAVVLCEPADWLPSPMPRRILQLMKNRLKKSLHKKVPHSDTGNYEEIGNYVYSISERELQKVALGLNLPTVAFKRFHDVYIEGVEFEKADDKSPLLKKIKKDISRNELLCRLGLGTKAQMTAIIFKEKPSPALREKLETSGFEVIDLPENPYLNAQP
jgi:ubiquinone/menaquinone biosynthesis C-methylase UbiE